MCVTCGCPTGAASNHSHDHHHVHEADHAHEADHVHGEVPVELMQNILAGNDAIADQTRRRLTAQGITTINLMSSPGSGKTRLLETTAAKLDAADLAVIEGDLETENDADRMRACGVQAYQITTGMACHLDATMVAAGVDQMQLDSTSTLFIENVGNLICPATFDLGQHANVVLLSVTEGADKAAKYPVMFRAADLVLITKADLLDVMDDFDINRAREIIAEIQPHAPILTVSSKTGEGLDSWLEWLKAVPCEPITGMPNA